MIATEEEVKVDICGVHFVGFIDLLEMDSEGNYIIVDHKSKLLRERSGRAKPTVYDKELDKYLRQLYLYAHFVKEKYGKFPSKLCFNCFRSQKRIEEPFNEDRYNEVIAWATESIRNIQEKREFEPTPDWFFCQNLCDCSESCEYKELMERK